MLQINGNKFCAETKPDNRNVIFFHSLKDLNHSVDSPEEKSPQVHERLNIKEKKLEIYPVILIGEEVKA
jgi:hypothetical protein